MQYSRQKKITRLSDLWEPHPGPQKKVIDLLMQPIEKGGVNMAFYGGMRGGGKTEAIIGLCLYRAGHPTLGQHESCIIIRRTVTELNQVIYRTMPIYSKIANYRVQERAWFFKNGGVVRFAYLDNIGDAAKYQGNEYTLICIDEAGAFHTPESIMLLKGSLRTTHPGIHCCMMFTGNPGGPGHTWLYDMFVKPAKDGNQIFVSKGMRKIFVPSSIEDNPSFIGERKTKYIDELKQVGSKAMVDAWLHGKWDRSHGSFFDCWSEDNIIPNVPIKDLPEGEFLCSIDWGSRRPCSVGWWFIPRKDWGHPTTHKLIRSGSMVRIHELYLAKEGESNTGLHLTAHEVAMMILAEEQREGIFVTDRVGDPSMHRADGGESIAQMMAVADVHFRPGYNIRTGRANVDGGWDRMRNMMKSLDLLVMESCNHFIDLIPSLPHNPRNWEDVDPNSEAHIADEARYAVMTRFMDDKKNVLQKYSLVINRDYHPLQDYKHVRPTFH